MNLEEELRAVVRDYSLGQCSMADLRDWLEDYALDLYESDEAVNTELADAAWLLLSEYDRGDRDEASLRVALNRALPSSVA